MKGIFKVGDKIEVVELNWDRGYDMGYAIGDEGKIYATNSIGYYVHMNNGSFFVYESEIMLLFSYKEKIELMKTICKEEGCHITELMMSNSTIF